MDLTQNYTFLSLGDLISLYDEDKVTMVLNAFEPYKDSAAGEYLREKAIPMEKRDLSRTYLAVSMDDNTILGFITIGMKCMRVPQENLLSKSVMRQMNIEENSGVAQAYLLGQLVRSKNTSSGFGDRLIDFAMEIFRESKRNVGCRIVRLDCSNELIPYYEKHGFKLVRMNNSGTLNQMIILI